MIQKWIKEQLASVIPELEWTVDYKTAQDHTGTVYMESPGDPSNDDFEMMYPTYSIELESSDRKNIEEYAWKVYDTMNKKNREIAQNNAGQSFEIIFIHAIPPLPLGIENKKMTYTVNLQTTVRKSK